MYPTINSTINLAKSETPHHTLREQELVQKKSEPCQNPKIYKTRIGIPPQSAEIILKWCVVSFALPKKDH